MLRTLRSISIWLAAALPLGAAAQTVPNTMEQRLLACAACHGDKGEGQSRNLYYPRLAGKPTGYLYNQLLNFRDKRREFGIMNYMVAYLSDAYLYEIAEHYAKLQAPYPAPKSHATPAELALGARLVRQGDQARKISACAGCHGKTLTGVEPAIPGLLGLHPPYIGSQIGAWKENKRHAMKPDCMHAVAQALTPNDVAAITAWLIAQPIPADPRPAPAGSLKLALECGGMNQK
jgi:cytochrome c553